MKEVRGGGNAQGGNGAGANGQGSGRGRGQWNGGGAGVGGTGSGHQGVNSAIAHIGPNFVRVKLGISLNDRAVEPSEVYVLQPFNPDERKQLPTVIDHAAVILAQQIATEAPTETTFDLL